ncbi:hypothetical protein [Cognatilysobacter bugurensis]|uniref:Uncharacterized protein n=1 Tax=Cognatilysobacter bugurensis TaxID=543356 RepID=A0A918SY97_9GAMM|nr:hypothetical protein [Lysobacter bugurensis]GHA73108.1 hypothetical protein GCM10007067_07180 [Lysobacter bugurensis]
MRRSVLTIALASLCGLAVASAVSQVPDIGPSLVAKATEGAPSTRMEGDQAMDDAVATAVIAAIDRQFGEDRVAVRLDRLAVKPASIRDRTVDGFGRIQLGTDAAWIPFRFEALYDTENTAVSYPRLVLGETQPGNELGTDSDIARALATRVDRALGEEFEQQPFELVIDRVATSPAGQRLVQVRGTGTVDFGADGATAAHIDALYDPVEARWLRVEYELGPTANWDTAPRATFAGR